VLCGRSDRQLKIRGIRVDPWEVEAALCAAPDVHRAALDVRPIADREQLVAWVQPIDVDTSALLTALRGRLPPAAVPDRIVAVRDWPSTTSGKLDIGALPDPSPLTYGIAPQNFLPDGEIEVRIARILTARLNAACIDRDADFFDLGGTSLVALIAAEEISDAFGVELSVRTILAARTVRRIGAAIRNLIVDCSPSSTIHPVHPPHH
jgi:acyl carrier protein